MALLGASNCSQDVCEKGKCCIRAKNHVCLNGNILPKSTFIVQRIVTDVRNDVKEPGVHTREQCTVKLPCYSDASCSVCGIFDSFSGATFI